MTRRPRLLLLCQYALLADRIGGTDRFFWSLNERMSDLPWDVTWAFPDSHEREHYAAMGLYPHTLPADSFVPAASRFIEETGPYDLMVSHFVPYATRMSTAWKRTGVKRYLAVDHMSRPIQPRPLAARLRLRAKGVALYPSIDGVVAVSDHVSRAVQGELGRFWRRKTEVIWNGVDPSIFAPTPKAHVDAPFHIVATAHLIPEKGLHVLLDALALAATRLSDYRVSIAGIGNASRELKAQAARLGLADRVDFLGNITYQAELLQNADVAVVPSLWQEACPFGVLEAMGAGVPVLASAVGGMPALLDGRAGLTVPPGDSPSLAEALVRLATDRSAARSIGAEGRSMVVERFNLPRMVDEHILAMSSLLPVPRAS